MNRITKSLMVAVCVLTACSTVWSDTIYVKDSASLGGNGASWAAAYKYLQDGLAAATGGDEVWVAAGSYKPDQDEGGNVAPGDPNETFQLISGAAIYGGFIGNETLLVQRDWQTNETILSGDIGTLDDPDDNSHHVVTGSGTDETAILDGFTITAGNADGDWPNDCGGGIINDTGSPTINNCNLNGNMAANGGGGIFNWWDSDPKINNCSFIGNSAKYGGGMRNSSSFSSPTITNCTFIGNSADNTGGGMHNDNNSIPTITNCIFTGNTALWGGGMSNHFSSDPTVSNCTFSGNSAYHGGGMCNDNSINLTVVNCILWGNTATNRPQIYDPSGSAVVSYSDIAGCGGSGGSWDPEFGSDGGGNIDADPLFVDADGADDSFGTEDDNLRPSPGSPCIDAGDNTGVPGGITTDLDGRPRFIDDPATPDTGNSKPPIVEIVDMGAYEYWPVIFIDSTATGNNDGTSWEDAFTDLQDGLDMAIANDQIWVAEGTYYPTKEVGGTGSRRQTFQMINGVEIYGGFPDTGDPNFADRDPDTYETILSGDIGTPGETIDNCYHVFYHPSGTNLDASAILDGFTIIYGSAYGSGDRDSGGGMYNYESSPTVTGCTFSGNSASYGGGMYNYDNSSPTVTNCTFSGNSADDGGGMYNYYYSDPTVTNCTFSGNSASYGGGMRNYDSSPTVTDSTFSGNSADNGGGMYNRNDSDPTVTNCTFSGNWADDDGGGVFNYFHSDPTVTDCTFSGNSADDGGGMYNYYYGSPTVTNCTFSGNSADYGGGMYNYNYSDPTVTNCTFSGNSASYGGGMYNDAVCPTLINCVFSGNAADWCGGGIYDDGNSSPTLINCIFNGNSAWDVGGGMYNDSGNPTLTNCTFSGNSVENRWGGGMLNDSASPTLNNCIFWGNIDSSGTGLSAQITTFTGGPAVHYSCIQDDDPDDESIPFGGEGNNNIDDDPLLVDPNGSDGIIGTEDDHLRLSPGSPCIDAGNNTAVPGDITTDRDGRPRFIDDSATPDTGNGTPPIVDMGVYEYRVILVDSTATGNNDGTSWEDAFTDLQEGLDIAIVNDQIWVAEGTYYPTKEVGGTGSRYQTFQMINGVGIYGGFPDIGDPNFADRDPDTYETILSGDVGTVDDPNDNCYHVFYHPLGTTLDTTAILDGFTITAGNADGEYPSPHHSGGGMYNYYYSNPTVTDCTFSDNSAKDHGGGMYNKASSSPTVTGCTFSGNSADGGGGMYNYYNSSPTVTNCTFSGNSADSGGGMCNDEYSKPMVTNCSFSSNSAEYGGGMRNDSNSSPAVTNCTFSDNSAQYGGGMDNDEDSDPTVTNCSFSGNEAVSGGGGMLNGEGSKPRITNCTFSGNSADHHGGGMYNSEGDPTVTNCTFSGNSAENFGGGMCNSDYSDPKVTNCILWDNTAPSGPQIYTSGTSSATVTYSDVQEGFTLGGNIDADPLFVDADGVDNIFGTEDDNLHLKSYSPCINKGRPFGFYSGQVDMDGEPRVLYDRVDMGADEVYPIAGDFEPDEDVDAADLAFFINRWLATCSSPGWCDGCDIDMSEQVNLDDFAKLATHWLKGTQ